MTHCGNCGDGDSIHGSTAGAVTELCCKAAVAVTDSELKMQKKLLYDDCLVVRYHPYCLCLLYSVEVFVVFCRTGHSALTHCLDLTVFFSMKCVVVNRDFTFLSLMRMGMGMEAVVCGDGWGRG